MPLECLILKMNWKDSNSKLTLVHSFYCIVELFDLCVLVIGIPNLSQLEKPLSWTSKIRDTKANWKIPRSLIEYLFDCLRYLLSPKEMSILNHLYDFKKRNSKGFISSLIFVCFRTSPSLLLSTLTQAKTFVQTFNTSFS